MNNFFGYDYGFYGSDSFYPNDPNIEYEYSYDNLGRKTQVETKDFDKSTTDTYSYDYDNQGRIIAVDAPNFNPIEYSYSDVTSQTESVFVDDTYKNSYGYDELGRLKTVTVNRRRNQPVSEESSYTYNPVGSRKSLRYANGNYAEYQYDALNRLTSLTNYSNSDKADTISSFEYRLAVDGTRLYCVGEQPYEGNPTNTTFEWTYDNLNRLITETADSSGDGYDCNYTYDLAGNRTQRIVNVNGQTLTTTYTHDPNTDRLIKETHSGPVYSFDAGNRQYFAYAAGGKSFYYRDLHGNKIGPVKAFFLGLPSVWSRYLFVLLIVLLPVMLFGPAVVSVIRRLVYCYGRPTRLRLRVPRKGICLLVAFVMLFGPEEFRSLAQADVQYANLSTATWAQGDTTIEYIYDANGSVKTKTTKVTSTQAVKETVTYDYNLQNRLSKVTTEDENGDKHIVEYIYNDECIRVRSYAYDVPYGQSIQNEKTVVYLVDEYNHTGYAQTLEEKTYNGTDTSGVPDSLTTYLIGDDVIAQTVDGDTQYLLYDGQGSTRQLAEYNGSVTIADSYSYDGYGVLLQDDTVASADPGKVSQQATNLLYAGEHFDADSQQYYLRARWYNPSNGLFNRMDDYSGSYSDPQSLHKYLYCQANPTNATDPSGQMSLSEINVSMVIQAALMTLNFMGAVYNFRRMGIATVKLMNSWSAGDFWDGLGYLVVAIVHGIAAAMNIVGMVAGYSAPPPGAIAALSVSGLGGISAGAIWASIVANPALAEWVVMQIAPLAMTAYLVFMAKMTGAGGYSSGGGSQEHHKIPRESKRYKYSDHKLVKQAGWTESDINKDPANIVRLGNHGGRHSSAYHRAIEGMLDEAADSVAGKGRVAADKALQEVLKEIDRGLADGTLRPYENKDVWIVPGAGD